LFFSDRQTLQKVAEVARALARGERPPAFHTDKDPYRALLADVHALASRLDEKSQAAEEEKNRLFAILEGMTEGVLVVDTEQRILLVNSALARAFGFAKEQAAGRFFWEMFRDLDINEMIQTALKERTAARREHAALLTETVFEILVSPVFLREDFLGSVAVFRDITRLKEFDRLRTEFVANVSHELKTPLTSILGFVETLKEGAVEDPENRMKFLQIIETQSLKLNALIEDLLLLSKVESAKDSIKLERVELSETIARLADGFEPLLKEKKLVIESSVAPETLSVMADPLSLERVLSNLIDNAVKYNRKEGRVTVRAFQDADGVKIEVADTGIGIEPADLARIFERFYRVDKSRARESGGSGLGLSIAKHAVERHGGRIEVESALGQGSKFTLILPK
jgi:two-component system, OmpR family, phosphate regulon sensor histidine kinase PhoR